MRFNFFRPLLQTNRRQSVAAGRGQGRDAQRASSASTRDTEEREQDTLGGRGQNSHGVKEPQPNAAQPQAARLFERVRYQQFTPHETTRLDETLREGRQLFHLIGDALPAQVRDKGRGRVNIGNVVNVASLPFLAPAMAVFLPLVAGFAPSRQVDFDPERLHDQAFFNLGLVKTAKRSADIVDGLRSAQLLDPRNRLTRNIARSEFDAAVATNPRLASLGLSDQEAGAVFDYLGATRRLYSLPLEGLQSLPREGRPFWFSLMGYAVPDQSQKAMKMLQEAGVLDDSYLPKDFSKLNESLFARISANNTFVYNLDINRPAFFGYSSTDQGIALAPHEAMTRVLDQANAPNFAAEPTGQQASTIRGDGAAAPSYEDVVASDASALARTEQTSPNTLAAPESEGSKSTP